jgi:uncharacterized protein (DUF2147 family)
MGLAPGFLPCQEVMMKRLLAVEAFLLASSTAQAQYTFEYGGHTIRIDPDRGTVSIPGVYDNTGTARKAKRPHNNQDSARSKQPPQDASPAPAGIDTAAAPSTTPQAPPAAAPASPAAATPNTSTTTANNAPADTAVAVPPAPASSPALLKEQAPAPRSEPPPTVAAIPPPAQATPPPAPAARDPNSPVGVWLTEEKEGKVRIEQCGTNLCGYSVETTSNLNGEQVLINMRPGKDQKWSGRILDPNTGSTYDSTIALKGSDTLRVQGCAFGGMFCGGQTWTRVN